MDHGVPGSDADRAPTGALARCVGDVERFLTEDWGRRFHLHRGGTDHEPLLALEDVDRILTQTSPRWPAFRLVDGGRTLPRSAYTRPGTLGGKRLDDLPDVGRIFELFHGGATIALQGLHRYWAPVTEFCRDLEEVLTHPVQANAYVTPRGSRGLDVHHDTHDVLAVQTYGTKHWVVHEAALEVPLASQRWNRDEHDPGPLVLETALTPGDCLYLPRGTPHAAETRDEASIHLTLGIRTVRWHDVLTAAMEEAGDDRALREALPPGFAHDPDALVSQVATTLKHAASWLENRDATEVARRVADDFWRGRPPLLAGQLEQVLRLEEIELSTPVVRRPGAGARLEATEDVRLLLGDRTLRLPLSTAPALRQLLTGEAVRPSDLDGGLDEESRLVLVRRLVREGILLAYHAPDE